MIPNCSITIYNKYIDALTRSEQYQRSQVLNVTQWGAKGVIQFKDGQLADNVKSFQVPFARINNYVDPVTWKKLDNTTRPLSMTFQEGDYIVTGLSSDDITSLFTISNLKDKYPDVTMIISVNSEDQGSLGMRHWHIGAK